MKVTWNRIRSSLDAEYIGLTEMKFIEPNEGQQANEKKLDTLRLDIVQAFSDLRSQI
jgi:hypothetical protein